MEHTGKAKTDSEEEIFWEKVRPEEGDEEGGKHSDG
jgi:hypothetical protein